MENYEILNILYKSNQTLVFKVRSLTDNKTYALKKFIGNFNAGKRNFYC